MGNLDRINNHEEIEAKENMTPDTKEKQAFSHDVLDKVSGGAGGFGSGQGTPLTR